MIGEYNTKEIAEEIIKIYSETKNQADNNIRNDDLSRLVSNSVLKTDLPKPICLEKTVLEIDRKLHEKHIKNLPKPSLKLLPKIANTVKS